MNGSLFEFVCWSTKTDSNKGLILLSIRRLFERVRYLLDMEVVLVGAWVVRWLGVGSISLEKHGVGSDNQEESRMGRAGRTKLTSIVSA
jgi:hypothetical protein